MALFSVTAAFHDKHWGMLRLACNETGRFRASLCRVNMLFDSGSSSPAGGSSSSDEKQDDAQLRVSFTFSFLNTGCRVRVRNLH